MLLIRNGDSIQTTVYRKATNNDLYLHWQSFAPDMWKKSTLKTLVMRAFKVCSTKNLMKEEINHLEKVFKEKNGYPIWVIKPVIEEVRNDNENETIDRQRKNTESNAENNSTTI